MLKLYKAKDGGKYDRYIVHFERDFDNKPCVTLQYNGKDYIRRFDTMREAELFTANKIKEKAAAGYSASKAEADMWEDERVMLVRSVKSHEIHNWWHKHVIKASGPSYVFVQPKLNGLCCELRQEGLFSRYGLPFANLEPEDFLRDVDLEGARLHGELYAHGITLEDITSMAKGQASTVGLRFYLFDIMEPELTQHDRLLKLARYTTDKIIPIQTRAVSSVRELTEYADYCKVAGFEGVIIRKPEGFYQFGKRSKDVFKMKPPIVKEFQVVGIERDVKDRVIFICRYSGKNFKVVPAWSDRTRIAFKSEDMPSYIECTFYEYTKAGLPRHAVAR